MKNKIIIGLVAMVLLVVGCTASTASLEKDLKNKADEYYTKYLDGKVIGIKNHKITLEALEKVEVNIEQFNKNECNKTETYAVIKLGDNDAKEITVTLSCKK